jgi:hypothetical protein
MPIRARILSRHGLIVSQGLGSVTLADLRKHRADLVNHPRHSRTQTLLFDMRRVTDLALNPDEIRDHAGFGNTGQARFSRIAILVSDDFTFGMARIFQAYASHRYDEQSLRVFRDAAEAWRWLRSPQAD